MPQPQPPSEKRRADVSAGRIAGAFGLHGELKLDASRAGEDAVRPGLSATLRLADGSERDVTIAGVRRHKGRPLIRLAGIDDANAAATLTGAQLSIARSDAPLGEGEYFADDLIGCRLIDPAGVERGIVAGVTHYPHQDVLVVGPQRALVPLVRAFIVAVDIARKEIRVDVPDGLLDPAAADEA